MTGFWADNSRYTLILLNRLLHFVPPTLSGVTVAIAAAGPANNKIRIYILMIVSHR